MRLGAPMGARFVLELTPRGDVLSAVVLLDPGLRSAAIE
jgi:hypothetical protein